MRKLKRVLVLTAFVLLVLSFNLNAEDWHIETVESQSDVGSFSSIVLDSNDYPHISYHEWSPPSGNDGLRYARWDGCSWQIEEVVELGGSWSSIELDTSENPHISFQYKYGTFDYSLGYAYHSGNEWNVEIVDEAHPFGTSIALEEDDNPNIAYIDSNSGYIKYARWNKFVGSWIISTVDDTGYNKGVSLELDYIGNPHISYYARDYEELRYAYFNGTSWEIYTVDTDVREVGIRSGMRTSIVLDTDDNPHISYYSEVAPGNGETHLKYAYWDGFEWQMEIVDEGFVGKFCSLDLDSNDNPHISYLQVYPDYYLKYAQFDGNNWQIEDVDTSGKAGSHTSIAITSKDNPKISYYASKVGYLDLRCAWIAPFDPFDSIVLNNEEHSNQHLTSLEIISISPNPSTDISNIVFYTSGGVDARIEIYDITGRLVKEKNLGGIDEGEHNETISTSNLSTGVYTVRVLSEKGTSYKRMVVVR